MIGSMFKILLSVCLSLVITASPAQTKPGTQWYYSLQEAQSIARAKHRLILLNFSGSDWCGPCIRMHKEIFDNADFQQLADSTLVLLNADFPRLRKNQLPAKQQQANDAMADRYNPKGKFPFTILLTEDGQPLGSWEGFPDGGEAAFTQQLQAVIAANRRTATVNRSTITANRSIATVNRSTITANRTVATARRNAIATNR